MATRKVAVQPTVSATHLHGFLTSVDTAVSTALGHVNAAAATSDAVVYGANSPTPARMSKKNASGRSEGSFVDVGSIATARAAGYKQTKQTKYRIVAATAFSKPVYVKLTVNTVNLKYAWRMPTATYTGIAASRTALGIKDVTTADMKTLVWGINNPKPPKAIKPGEPSYSTFYDPDEELPTGWTGAGAGTDE